MTLQQYGNPISILDIATEFGGDVGRPHNLDEFYAGAGRVPAGAVGYPNGPSGGAVPIPSPGNPISLRNFYGASNIVFNVSDRGLILQADAAGQYYSNQAFAEIIYRSTGVQSWRVGTNAAYATPVEEPNYWIDSVPDGGDRSSVTSQYDFMWQFLNGDTLNTNTGSKVWTHDISPAFGVRVNLGSTAPSIFRMVEARNSSRTTTVTTISSITLRALIYDAGTNNIRSNVVHYIDLYATSGALP